MSHKHSIYDTDLHFKIDPNTRAITNMSKKVVIAQYDHNSERFTFEIPRLVDGHDMSLCNKVEIHYINNKYSDVYEVDDLRVYDGDSNIVVFSWLLSKNVSQNSGPLNFAIRFKCVTGDVIDYAWGSGVFSGINILNSFNNEGSIDDTEYTDVLTQWHARFTELESSVETSEAERAEEFSDNLTQWNTRVTELETSVETAEAERAEEFSAIKTESNEILNSVSYSKANALVQSASGSIVQVYADTNSILSPKVYIEATQTGTGDPSPENVRPIVGVDEVNVTRCGENLLDFDSFVPGRIVYGMNIEKDGDYIRLYGTASVSATTSTKYSFSVGNVRQPEIQGKGCVITLLDITPNNGVILRAYGLRTSTESSIAVFAMLQNGQAVDVKFRIMVTPSETPIAYSPYSGTTHTIALPETSYGGYVDWVRGKYVQTHGNVRVTSVNSNVNDLGNTIRVNTGNVGALTGKNVSICDRLPMLYNFAEDAESHYVNEIIYIKILKSRLTSADLSGVNAWLAANPLTVVYELATPVEHDLTLPVITALDGITTVYSGASSIDLTYNANALYIINQLSDRIAALEALQVSTTSLDEIQTDQFTDETATEETITEETT